MKKILTASLIAASITCTAKDAKNNTEKKPDILLLFLDDLTYNGIGALGNTEVITPNLDNIVRSGVNFCNTFNQGGWHGAISVASRAQLLTGRYMWNAKEAEDKKFEPDMAARSFLPQVLESAGYLTFMTGKWHTAHVMPEMIFNEVELPFISGMPKDTPDAYNRPQSPEDDAWKPWDTSKGGYWGEDGIHRSVKQTDIIVNRIEKNSESDKPLFMYCAFNAPHDLRQAPKEYIDLYDVNKISVPAGFLPRHPYAEQMGTGENMRDEKLAPYPRTEYAVRKHRQEYYALISHVDTQIGRIIKALTDAGLYENTIIILTADNGLSVGRHGLMGKQSMYDHSMRVPFVIAGKGIPRGETRNHKIYMQDMVPTVYEILGLKTPKSVDFESLLPIIKNGKAKESHPYIYGAFENRQRMIRDNKYKLFFIPEAEKFYLFDLENDPDEINDLSNNPNYAKIIKKMGKQFLAEAVKCGDKIDLRPIFPKVFHE